MPINRIAVNKEEELEYHNWKCRKKNKHLWVVPVINYTNSQLPAQERVCARSGCTARKLIPVSTIFTEELSEETRNNQASIIRYHGSWGTPRDVRTPYRVLQPYQAIRQYKMG